MSQTNNAGLSPGLTAKKTLERAWEGLPGYILMFPVSIALSGSMTTEREQTIGLSKEERADLLLDFRVKLLADVLTEVPMMLDIEKAIQAVADKQDKAYLNFMEGKQPSAELERGFVNDSPEYQVAEKAEREARERAEKVALTIEELNGLCEFFPDWETLTQDKPTLPEKITAYFGQKDDAGRDIYQLLVEAIIQDYWAWATPRPTISASAFLQNKRLFSTTN